MRRKHFIFLCFAIVGIVLPISMYNQTDAKVFTYSKKNYVVEPGDTLWNIAERTYPHEHTGKMVYEISKLNEIHDAGNLRIGTELILP